MIIRAEQPGDLPVIDALLEAGFPGQPVAAVVRSLRDSPDWRGLGLVAEDAAGAVSGYVALSAALLDRRDRLIEVLVLSPLAVRPDRQGQGIGAALIAAAIATATAHGAPAVFVEGDPAFYSRHGFTAAGAEGSRRPSLRIPGPAFQVCRLDAEASLAGSLIYPRAFWDHDCVGLRDPDLAAIEAALG